MKVNLKAESVFTISVGEQSLGRFRKMSSWEGFMKLESEDEPRQFLIVMTEQSRMTQELENLMGEFFGSASGNEYVVVAASPDLIAKLKDAAGVPKAPATVKAWAHPCPHSTGQVLLPQGSICTNCGAKEPPGVPVVQTPKRWPFVETPGEFTERLAAAMREFPKLLAAVRYVLIETPPTLAYGVPEGAK
jgi:hypothetical protein